VETRNERGFTQTSRGIAALLAVLILAASVTPADAGGWKHHQPKYRRHAKVVAYQPRTVVVHESCNSSAFAGFVGGIVLGTVLTSAAYANDAPHYIYYDPYCGSRYTSMDACRAHFVHSRHPRVIQVIEYGSGRCVDTYTWHRGHWHDDDCCD